MNKILNHAKELNDTIINHRRTLHKHPEIGMDLPVTAEYVFNQLKEMGYQPQMCGPSGVTATVGTGGKTILLRADMDALPMEEKSGLEFSSEIPERAHTCGHDTHAAMLLGAAQILKDYESELKGTVKLMFQPGEEIFAGAKSMIANGVLENPKVDAALGMHIFPMFPLGTVGYCSKEMMASVDGFKITIHGVGSHGAQSFVGVDPINIGAHIHTALQEIISREIDSAEQALLTIGQFTAGNAANIIPDTAVMMGTIRTFNNEVRTFIVERMKAICKSVAETFRGTAEVEMLFEVSPLNVDEAVKNDMVSYVKDLDSDFLKLTEVERLQGSEDFAAIAEKVPSAFFVLGADYPGEDTVTANHNPAVLFNEKALPYGAAIHANCAMKWLENHSSNE